MATVWSDVTNAMNNQFNSNKFVTFSFVWQFITFSGETQDSAEVRWRRADDATTIATSGAIGFMRPEDPAYSNLYSSPLTVGRFEDKTTWTISGGDYVPPAEGNRRYSNITHVTFPLNFFSEGVWIIQVRIKPTGQDWTGWSSHKIEINQYDDRQSFETSATAVVKGPNFGAEGIYGGRVEVVSACGTSAVSNEQTFDVWETDKYLKDGADIRAVPELRNNGTITGRVKRTL